jgi:hypothetical protein
MKGVLTHKELAILQREKRVTSEEPVKEAVKIVSKEAPPFIPVEENLTEEHFFFHPDNPKNSSGYREGVFKVLIEGVSKSIPIKNGVLSTDNPYIRKELLKQGFVFMYSKPKGEMNE